MSLQTFNDYISRVGSTYYLRQPIWGEIQTATTGSAAGTGTLQRVAYTPALPSLPSGVTAWIPTAISISCSTANVGMLVAKIVNLGSFDISNTNTGTFTDGSAMPTQTVFNTASTSLCSAVLTEITTATTGTQTNVTVTYKNHAGTGGQTTIITPVTAAVTRSVSYMPLAVGDWGVQDITAVTRVSSAGPTGVIAFYGIIPLSFMPTFTTSAPMVDNLITSGVNLHRLGAGDTIGIFCLGSGAVKAAIGELYCVADN